MILIGDCIQSMRGLSDASVQTCITSPPYFGLRDYGNAGQIGLEATPAAFVAKLVEVFREVRRVLRDDGTLWLNLGDSYAAARGGTHQPAETLAGGKGGKTEAGERVNRSRHDGYNPTRNAAGIGLKHKDLIGIPWRVAFALQADGWYLRQDIIWSKPNPMPESVRDRCTKAHEYLFLLSKGPRYYYDQEAIREPCAPASVARLGQDVEGQVSSDRVPGKTNGTMKAVKFGGNNLCPDTRLQSGKEWTPRQGGSGFTPETRDNDASGNLTANKRSVWTVPTMPFKEAHFATFPEALIEPCILAGSRPGDTVLDPFGGAGTTGVVAQRLGREHVLCELNPEYAAMSERRIRNTQPGLALGVAA